ncbi:hypothetical protein AB1L88_19470 [Tautonia sp. JC769]|uniref:hypothetical protein n=1 Tax=Tautonia sp. JC769 TaxID=3232135 RepID=UPI00345882A7
MLSLSASIALAALTLAPTPTPSQDARESFRDSLLGVYAMERGQRGDERVSDEELQGTVRITPDRISLHRADGGEIYAARYQIDEVSDGSGRLSLETVKVKSETDDELQTESDDTVGTKGKALVSLDETPGFLTLIYDAQGEDYPDDFKPDHEKEHLFVLKKQDAVDQ